MISKSGRYWSTGIAVRWMDDTYRNENDERVIPAWGGVAEFFDDGFADDDVNSGAISTQGELRTRYLVAEGQSASALSAVVDALRADAERLGIDFNAPAEGPYLYYLGDGEHEEWPPPAGWRELMAAEAQRIGWRTPYTLAAKEA